MSLLSKLTVAAVTVLGVRALTRKPNAKALTDGTPAHRPAKAPTAGRKTASAKERSTASDAKPIKSGPKARPRKRSGRRTNAKRAKT